MELSVRRLFLPGGTYSGGPYELRLPRLPVSAAGGRVAAPSIRCALLAYRWPRPQQLLAASAAGGARRRCSRLRCCSNPPARVRLTFAQKKTASVSLHQRFFHGRGWITQAAHLKRPRRGLFAAGTYSGGRCCSNPPAIMSLMFMQKKTASVSLH